MSDAIATCVPILGLQVSFEISFHSFLSSSHIFLASGELLHAPPMDAALDLELSLETVAVLCCACTSESGDQAELVTRISVQSRSFFSDGY